MLLSEIKTFVEFKKRIPVDYRTNLKLSNVLIDIINQYKLSIQNPDIYVLARYLKRDLYNQKFSDDCFCEIESIEPIGKENTYDLSIENGHSYVANQIICHNTCNLPATTTESEINDIYMLAWKSKLKGITIYREGSRQGVMTDRNDTTNVDIKDSSCPKRPSILPCEIHYSNIQGNAWILFVGLLNGRPFEIMGGKKKNIEIPKKYKTGWIKKNGKNADGNSTYDLYLGSIEESDDRMQIKDIIAVFTPDAGSYTRIISGMLSHGVPIKFICEQLRKDSEKAHMASFEAVIARILKKGIKDGELASEDCPTCKAKLVYKDGCICCINCGFSKCN